MQAQYYEVYLSFGSNIGDRRANIETSLKHLNDLGVKAKKLSSLYESEAWGNTNQPSFLNGAGSFETILAASELMKKILTIENQMGRQREEKWQPRIIDIDILFFENEIISEVKLKIPHPELHNRKFVLIPMVEIAPEFVHPVLKKPIIELLNQCSDELRVELFNP